MTKQDLAIQYKHSGCNCCQAILAAYADELGIDLADAKKMGAAFAAGMGGMQGNCGALVGAEMVLGMKEYDGRPIGAKARNLYAEFANRCKAVNCMDIKGISTGEVLCSCDDCVRNAVDILEDNGE